MASFLMLRFLRIRSLAVIDAVEVEFEPGFNVLTGETGAGKSMLVEAVGLLLGGRASADLVRTGEDSATIEALFDTGGAERAVRREITAQGRSRAFVDGALVTAGALKELAARLVELHGQHEHQTLLDPATHVGVLDAFGRLEPLAAPVAAAFDRLQAVTAARDRIRRADADRATRQELVAFQLAELERAALREAGEDAELAARRQVLASAERVERLCAESYASLYERDEAVLAALGGVWRRVGELAAIDPRFLPYLEAREGIKAQLEELAFFLRRYADGIEASPARLQAAEERLALLERVKRKYGPTLADAIALRDGLRREQEELAGGRERIAELERDLARARAAYLSAAAALGRERRAVARAFAGRLERLLAELAMERTRFEVRFSESLPAEPAWSARGTDDAEFFVSPNPGEELRPLARIVSGGELSRIMLAIKTLTATTRLGAGGGGEGLPGAGAPGLIFDEIDAGIGGRVADVVGRTLRALGSAFQVLCITHLPQIAASGDAHFQIAKRVEGGRTRTRVVRLDEAGRVEELARMLGGEAVTEQVRRSAREMLAARRGDRGGAKGEGGPKGESESPRRRGGGSRRAADE